MSPSLIKTVGEGVFWVSSSTLIIKAVSIATIVLILSHLSVAEYGMLELALSIPALFGILLLPGVDSLVIADMGTEVGRGRGRTARSMLGAYLAVQYALAAAACLAVVLLAPLLARAYDLPLIHIGLVSALFLIGPLRTSLGVLFRVRLQFFLFSLLSFLEELAKLAALVLIFWWWEAGISAVIAATIIAQLFAVAALAPFYLQGVRSLAGGPDEPVSWRFLLGAHGLWGMGAAYLGSLSRALRLWLIQRLLGPEAVGLYAVASGLLGHTMALFPLSTVLSSLLPQHVHDRVRFGRLLLKSIQYQFIANMGLIVAAFFLFPPILSLIFPEYAAAFPLFQLLLMSLIPGAVVTGVTPAFYALKLQKSLFGSMALKAALTVAATYLGIALFGLWGVAAEAVLTAAVQAYERMRSLRRHVPELPPLNLLRVRFDEDDRLVLAKLRAGALRLIGR